MSGIRFSPRPNRAHEINWQEWGEGAFETARLEDRPVLLSISAVWCHWCHVMDETAYSDPNVIALINKHYVPVRVDNDERPDINSRYNMGGWPTTAFLTPDGHLVTGATYMSPDQLKAALTEVSEAYRQQKDTLLQRGREIELRRRQRASPATEGLEADASIVDSVVRTITDAYDTDYGGFGTEPKFPMVPACGLLLHMYRCTGEARYRAMAEKTLDAMMVGGLYDRQEGGFYRYSTTRDWSVPHFEKMLEGNVGLLGLYLDAHVVTGNAGYAEVASRIIAYLQEHLFDAALGAFYGSQDADEEYYSLPLAQRRKRVPPVVDPTFYTSLNAMVASAYLKASWVLDRREHEDVGLRTLEFLLAKCKEGPLRHSYSSDGRTGTPALLVDHAYLVIALVDAYGSTSQPRYLAEAERVAEEMTGVFGDQHIAGFYDVPDDQAAWGQLRVREVPLDDNVTAIEALTRLSDFTLKGKYRESAAGAIRAFVSIYAEYGEAAAGYALAVHRSLYSPVEVSVVGIPGRADSKGLLTAAATIPYPHVAVKYIDAGDQEALDAAGYWPADEANAYVCLNTVCLAPVSDTRALHGIVAEFMDAGTEGIGGPIQIIAEVPSLDINR